MSKPVYLKNKKMITNSLPTTLESIRHSHRRDVRAVWIVLAAILLLLVLLWMTDAF